jgi:predicted  nucleic acid-binding Zn-ribbon protein
MKRSLTILMVTLSILLIASGVYLLNDNSLLSDYELLTLKAEDGSYVFMLGSLILIATFLTQIPNKN